MPCHDNAGHRQEEGVVEEHEPYHVPSLKKLRRISERVDRNDSGKKRNGPKEKCGQSVRMNCYGTKHPGLQNVNVQWLTGKKNREREDTSCDGGNQGNREAEVLDGPVYGVERLKQSVFEYLRGSVSPV